METIHYRVICFHGNLINVRIIQMRVDVHGACPVTYGKSGLTVTMVKDMTQCHFPSRVNWPYSPLSLFWNMVTPFQYFTKINL